MPRPKKPGAEPKKRSRTGCWPCKGRKVKCGEERPRCTNCERVGEKCDYSIRLNWDSRRGKKTPDFNNESNTGMALLSNNHEFTIVNHPAMGNMKQIQPAPPKSNSISMNSSDALNLVPAKSLSQPVLSGSRRNKFPSQQGSSLRSSPEHLSNSLSSITNFNAPMQLSDSPVNPHSSDVSPSNRPSFENCSPQPFLGGSMFSTFQANINVPDAKYVSPQSSQLFLNSLQLPTAFNHPERFYPRPRQPSSNSSQSPSLLEHFKDNSPRTPAQSSPCSEDDSHLSRLVDFKRSPPLQSPVPRLDVNSLLSDNPIEYPQRAFPISVKWSDIGKWDEAKLATTTSDDTFFFGFDLGRKDRDLMSNDDANAILSEIPVNGEITAESPPNSQDIRVSSAWCPMDTKDVDYYRDPIRIVIPRKYMPLPPFIIFLTTQLKVGLLMPYDDIERNPYRNVLPEIAVAEPHLLRLLLAYSASHRARLLGHKEPELRMAQWILEVIPQVKFGLNPDNSKASIANLASSIMLASLEVISPNAFGSQISWQNHLITARYLMMNRNLWRSNKNTKEGECCAFLWSWFVYLDLLGSLSGGPWSHDISSNWVGYYDSIGDDQGDMDEIDCIMGFTIRCVRLLARVSDLCRRSDSQRLNSERAINHDWRPDQETLARAERLDDALRESMGRNGHICDHVRPGVDRSSLAEMFATNEAFHWAGLVHLHQRALGKPKEHNDVAYAVNKIIQCMDKVRDSGTGEMGILFPMFTAGCNTTRGEDRQKIDNRFNNIEAHGMKQVSKARKLLKKVWDLNQPWETLLKDEFIG
ncbi:hypothetical protein Cpir12675_006650 [Ceratocystis pirilliformis]|uniref:Zn(2)-C6 fungal-type domain-containing protein n=1 Tax=Ceratocystis pirilliformis TaxID=259994 RepID=A0ABR3YFV9_9PEZI